MFNPFNYIWWHVKTLFEPVLMPTITNNHGILRSSINIYMQTSLKPTTANQMLIGPHLHNKRNLRIDHPYQLITVLKKICCRAATCNPLKPPQGLPNIPALQLDQDSLVIQSSISNASSCSCLRYSSNSQPPEFPQPRISTLILAYQWPAQYRCLSESRIAVKSFFCRVNIPGWPVFYTQLNQASMYGHITWLRPSYTFTTFSSFDKFIRQFVKLKYSSL